MRPPIHHLLPRAEPSQLVSTAPKAVHLCPAATEEGRRLVRVASHDSGDRALSE
mgnify:CR=1 FL=1